MNNPIKQPDDRIDAVNQFALDCNVDYEHLRQVTFLSLLLFDTLKPLHHLDERERFWLYCAAMLHDIGWKEGWQSHHKTSLRMIMESQVLPFDAIEKLIVASIARYHRKALPDVKHSHYFKLTPAERTVVSKLAALLRIADGLDCTHTNAIRDLACEIGVDEVTIQCKIDHSSEAEALDAQKKADLFIAVYHLNPIFLMTTHQH